MAAIDFPRFLPRESRKVVFAIGGSLLLHAVLLAWLPPLARDIGQALPAMLEVRLIAAAPAASAAPSAPAVKQLASAARTAAPLAAPSPPSLLPAESAPVQAQPVATRPLPAEPAPGRAEIAVTPPDLRAAYLSNPRPPYPLAARRLGVEGRVMLRAEILESGGCGRISVAQSSGHELLDQAALQAVKQWHFVPARRGGEAVAAWAEIPIRFSLRDEATGS